MKTLAATMLSLALVTPAKADWFDCRGEKSPRHLVAQLSGATSVQIIGRAGALRVTGRAGASEVTATGSACSTDAGFLQRMQIVARRSGESLLIEAVIPERSWDFGEWEARLDFEVIVPPHLPLRVKDGSGSLSVRDVGSLEVTDGSGSVEIRGVRGDVSIVDGSGSLRLSEVGGEVSVQDGSGDIEIERAGAVHIKMDGSGGIDITGVERDVRIDVDGAGSIDVSNVRGDFIVQRDGSGRVEHSRVAGRIQIPERD